MQVRAMNCITCRTKTEVIDSRVIHDEVRRRRWCSKCKTKHTTYEITKDERDRLRGVAKALELIVRATK